MNGLLAGLLNFATLVQAMAASVQGSARTLVDLSVGSMVRALLEANAAIALWMQWLILQVLALTRAATSNGPDLDSFVADYGLTRLAATYAVGSLTFSRQSTNIATTIPVGATAVTSDFSQTFAVVADPTNPAYSQALQSFSLPAGVMSITVAAQAVVAGAAGNVLAGAIGLAGTTIAGVDTVTNINPFASGMNPESDTALRLRFQAYFNTRSRGTVAAIQYAVTSAQQGLVCQVLDDQDTLGNYAPGHFTVVVDDGTGSPSAATIALAQANVELYRSLGISYGVVGPTLIGVTISFSLTVAPGITKATMAALARSALVNYVDGLTIGELLAYTAVPAVVYRADPNFGTTQPQIVNVTNVLVNGAAADVVPNPVSTGLIKLTGGLAGVTVN